MTDQSFAQTPEQILAASSPPLAAQPAGGQGLALTPSGRIPDGVLVASTHLSTVGYANGVLAALGANVCVLAPLEGVFCQMVFSRVQYVVGTTGGNTDIGVYFSDDEATFYRVASTGSFATPAAGARTATLAFTVAPAPKRRWYLAGASSSAAMQFQGDAALQLGFTKATSFPLPSSLTGMTTGGNMPNLVALA